MAELGIESKIIGIRRNDITKLRFIYANGKINPLPSSISSLFFRQDPFSRSIVSVLAKEIFVKKNLEEDETIYDFFLRRFNKEVSIFEKIL